MQQKRVSNQKQICVTVGEPYGSPCIRNNLLIPFLREAKNKGLPVCYLQNTKNKWILDPDTGERLSHIAPKLFGSNKTVLAINTTYPKASMQVLVRHKNVNKQTILFSSHPTRTAKPLPPFLKRNGFLLNPGTEDTVCVHAFFPANPQALEQYNMEFFLHYGLRCKNSRLFWHGSKKPETMMNVEQGIVNGDLQDTFLFLDKLNSKYHVGMSFHETILEQHNLCWVYFGIPTILLKKPWQHLSKILTSTNNNHMLNLFTPVHKFNLETDLFVPKPLKAPIQTAQETLVNFFLNHNAQLS